MTEEQLKMYDIYILIDKSGSMSTPDVDGKERWDAAREQTETWARAAQKWDADGISVGFYNNSFKIHENVTAERVADIFKEHTPGGSTDTDKPLDHILNNYLTNRKKPILVFVITDGGANDQSRVARVIADATKKMNDDSEIGIQFLQIGKDSAATKFLQFLDDELVAKYGAKFDVVDTNTFEVAQEMSFFDLCVKTLSD
jgi:uncharacterized protein with von Willebrand factor type A (vWA) domain